MTASEVSDDLGRLRRVALGWLVITALTGPVAYGGFLFLTLPVLAALLARLYVGPRRTHWTVLAWLSGPTLLVAGIVLVLRADEVLSDGLIAGSLTLASAAALILIRRRNRAA